MGPFGGDICVRHGYSKLRDVWWESGEGSFVQGDKKVGVAWRVRRDCLDGRDDLHGRERCEVFCIV
jgi:hypothetical protein